MKKLLVLGCSLLIALTTVACSQNEGIEPENQTETPIGEGTGETNGENEEVEKPEEETETPETEASMIFDPETIKVGDHVGHMVVEEATVYPKTAEYPTTTYEITFSGSIISKGTLKRMAVDDEFFADEIIFTPSNERIFPKGNNDERYVWLVLTNKDDVLRDIPLENGEEKEVELELEGYVVSLIPTETANSSIYDGIVK